MDKNTKNWYAVYTKSRTEKKVAMLLEEKRIEYYLPLQRKLKQWSDRKRWVEEPLIRSYVFVMITIGKDYQEVLNTDHVVRYITFEGKAAKIPEKQIETIKLLLSSREELEVTHENFEPGMNVIVKAGQLLGLEGTLVEVRGKNKVQIRIESIGQSVLVEIPTVYLRKNDSGK